MENESLTVLQEMFPDLDQEILEAILQQNNYYLQESIDQIFAMQDESVPVEKPKTPENEELPPEIMIKIISDLEVEKKDRLKQCKEYDKKLKEAIVASEKQYKTDLKKEKKAKEKEEKEKRKKEKELVKEKSKDKGKELESQNLISQENVFMPKDTIEEVEAYEKSNNQMNPFTVGKGGINVSDDEDENISSQSLERLSFKQKMKNLFKSNSKKKNKNEKLDIEIPDIIHHK